MMVAVKILVGLFGLFVAILGVMTLVSYASGYKKYETFKTIIKHSLWGVGIIAAVVLIISFVLGMIYWFMI